MTTKNALDRESQPLHSGRLYRVVTVTTAQGEQYAVVDRATGYPVGKYIYDLNEANSAAEQLENTSTQLRML